MSWFNNKKSKISKELEESRKKLNEQLDFIHSQYVTRIENEDVPILEVIPVGKCWLEFKEGVQVSEPNFPYDKADDVILMINAKEGVEIGPHKHYEDETIHVITGEYEEMLTKKHHYEGESKRYPSLKAHGIRFIKDSIVIVHYKK